MSLPNTGIATVEGLRKLRSGRLYPTLATPLPISTANVATAPQVTASPAPSATGAVTTTSAVTSIPQMTNPPHGLMHLQKYDPDSQRSTNTQTIMTSSSTDSGFSLASIPSSTKSRRSSARSYASSLSCPSGNTSTGPLFHARLSSSPPRFSPSIAYHQAIWAHAKRNLSLYHASTSITTLRGLVFWSTMCFFQVLFTCCRQDVNWSNSLYNWSRGVLPTEEQLATTLVDTISTFLICERVTASAIGLMESVTILGNGIRMQHFFAAMHQTMSGVFRQIIEPILSLIFVVQIGCLITGGQCDDIAWSITIFRGFSVLWLTKGLFDAIECVFDDHDIYLPLFPATLCWFILWLIELSGPQVSDAEASQNLVLVVRETYHSVTIIITYVMVCLSDKTTWLSSVFIHDAHPQISKYMLPVSTTFISTSMATSATTASVLLLANESCDTSSGISMSNEFEFQNFPNPRPVSALHTRTNTRRVIVLASATKTTLESAAAVNDGVSDSELSAEPQSGNPTTSTMPSDEDIIAQLEHEFRDAWWPNPKPVRGTHTCRYTGRDWTVTDHLNRLVYWSRFDEEDGKLRTTVVRTPDSSTLTIWEQQRFEARLNPFNWLRWAMHRNNPEAEIMMNAHIDDVYKIKRQEATASRMVETATQTSSETDR